LWPLSRQAFPKQFIKMFNGKSTFQLAIERIAPAFGIENIIISTTRAYRSHITEQLPELPLANIIEEPEKRDLGPAVGLNLIHLKKLGYSGPVALLWADHLMDNVPEFITSLKTAEKICTDDPKKVVLISEKPRFPNNNLGWIHFGEQNPDASYKFIGFKYKPEFAACSRPSSSSICLRRSASRACCARASSAALRFAASSVATIKAAEPASTGTARSPVPMIPIAKRKRYLLVRCCSSPKIDVDVAVSKKRV